MKLVASVAFVLCACATSSEVVPTGADTFMVTAHGVMGQSSGGEQKVIAFGKASSYCQAQGKTVEQVNMQATPGGFGQIASADLQFRCVKP
jgi:hypothetical protein